jgi:hypothetical protein
MITGTKNLIGVAKIRQQRLPAKELKKMIL